MIGAGTQFLAIVFCIFMLALVGVFYPYNRGALYTASIVLYALTAGISGYVSAGFYKQMGGTRWVRILRSKSGHPRVSERLPVQWRFFYRTFLSSLALLRGREAYRFASFTS